ncbi:MAG: ribokinase [Rhodoglobus sp.]|nr:ribokinase [Rhodoglobus sp.]
MIAVVGGYGVGLTMRVRRAPAPGETVADGILSIGPGGKGSNQAIAISRLGHAVALFTAIGADAAGRDAIALWEAEGVDATGVVTPGGPTMTGFITVDAAGENRISIAPGALAALSPDDVESFRERIREAELLVVSLEVPVPVAVRALGIAREEGTPTLLNPAPAADLSAADWALVDTVTPNSIEAAMLLGSTGLSPAVAAEALASATGCAVVMTLGTEGVIVRDGSESHAVAPVPVPAVVDTTGAGDAFTAALAVGIVEGMTLHEAARFAAAAGAHAVTIEDVVPSLPTRDGILSLLDSAGSSAQGGRSHG